MTTDPTDTFKTLGQSTPPLPDSLPVLTQKPRLTRSAVERATFLLGCYRAGDAADPETYIASVSALLASYPEDVMVAVTDPVRGIASKSKFLPTLSEVRDACEEAMQPRRKAAQRAAERARVEEQLAERDRLARVHAELDVARVDSVAAKFAADQKALHERSVAEEAERRQKIRAGLEAVNATICTIDTPSGIKVSPWLRKYLDAMAAGQSAQEFRTGLPDRPDGRHRE